MNRKEAEDIFRGRKTIIDNIDNIIAAVKGSSKYDLADQGQLDLFGAGLEVEKAELTSYSGPIDTMGWVRSEMDVMGVPYTYNPLDDLDIYRDLYCTHDVTDLLDFNEDKSGVIVLDWITDITHHTSKEKGNPYVRIYTSLGGADKYWFLWGKEYQSLINRVFVNEIYLFELSFRIGTTEYPSESINITHLKNIKDVDIESEYIRVINSATITSELNEDWMIRNRK